MILTTVIHQAQLELCIKESKKLVENPSFEYRLALAQCLLKSAQPPEGIEGNSHTEFAHHNAVQMIICTSHRTTWMVKAVKFVWFLWRTATWTSNWSLIFFVKWIFTPGYFWNSCQQLRIVRRTIVTNCWFKRSLIWIFLRSSNWVER